MARRSDHTRDELTEMALESARAIVIEQGIAGLSGRKVTGRMGYTIGTLYQIFSGMDDLVETMNARTLEMLYEKCRPNLELEAVADQLRAFGLSFIEFVKEHPREWHAVMSYRYGEEHTFKPEYDEQVRALFGLMRKSTGHLYGEDEAKEHATDMGVLWASLTGIFSVAASERHVGGLTLEQMIDRLIGIYLQSRK